MQIELTKEELLIINDLCFEKIINLSQVRGNEYIDVNQIDSMLEKLRLITDKVCIDK